MKFHVPSFLMGFAAGIAGSTILSRFRPLLTELASAGYAALDALSARAAVLGENVEDLLAEARSSARTRGARAREAHTRRPVRPRVRKSPDGHSRSAHH
ncbi:MAG: hypothetical protein AB7V27_19030 [Candidatus Binatia bacterium]